MIRRLFLLSLLAGLTACTGWQLRGGEGSYTELRSLQGIYLRAAADNAVALQLGSRLDTAGIDRLDGPQPDSLGLELQMPQLDSRVQSLSGDLRARQIRLEMTQEFRILDAQGNELLRDRLAAVRTYQQNPLEPASAERQRQQLSADMAAELAGALLDILPAHLPAP